MEIEETTSKMDVDESENKEWPGIWENKDCVKRVNLQLLIMELGRLVPFVKGKYIRFFPINMPMIEIGCTYIIGVVLEVTYKEKRCELIVDDGTGTLAVMYNLKHSKTPNEDEVKAQTSKDNSKSTVSIKRSKVIQLGNYVHLEGFLSLYDYKKTCTDEDPLKGLKYGRPVFYAVDIKFISEKEYYEKMRIWLKKARERYIHK